MKNLTKIKAVQKVAIIAIITVIGFSMIACDPNNDDTPSYSLNGIWDANSVGSGFQVTVNGATGTFSGLYSTNAITADAVNKSYITVGGQAWRNITSTGNLTWSGQFLGITSNTSSPNVATGTQWVNCTFTMSADGQTIQMTSTAGNITYVKGNYSINGFWDAGNIGSGFQINVSGSTGTFSNLSSTNALTADAVNKSYLSIGGQAWRNIISAGNLTWSGQFLGITSNTSSPNVATGTQWINCTFTMSADGQTIQMTSTAGNFTYLRWR